MMGAPLLECRNLVREFHQGESLVRALSGISFTLQKGESLCVSGRSGSGKTTLLNCVGALDAVTSGEVFFEGKAVHNLAEKERLLFRRGKIGFIFQEPHLFPYLSVLENVALPLVFSGESWEKAGADAGLLLEQVGLGPRLHHPARWLSGGEAQRAAIARALIARPLLLLADEPTAELDGATSRAIIALLFAQKEEGRALIVATHDPMVERAAGRAIRLEDGKRIT